MKTLSELSNEILEKLRGNRSFKVSRCPTAFHEHRGEPTRDWQKNAKPEHPNNCCCEDVVYTGEFAIETTFNLASIIIAHTYTNCWKWEYHIGKWMFDPKVTAQHGGYLEYRQVERNWPADEIRKLLGQASSREAEMLANLQGTDLARNYNKGHINIRGVPFPTNRVRKALMYQTNQKFDATVITHGPKVPEHDKEGCSLLMLRGGLLTIIVSSQSYRESKEHIGMTSIGYNAFE
jgi:hypothetical protein